MKRVVCIVIVALLISTPVFAATTNTWSMAGGTPDRRHISSGKIMPPLAVAWDTGTEGSVFAVPPILTSRYAYLGMAKPPDHDQYLMSIQKYELSSGNMVWQYDEGWWIWGMIETDLVIQGYSNKKKQSWLRRVDSDSRQTKWEIDWLRYTVTTAVEDDVIYSLSYTDYKEAEDKPLERTFFFQAHAADSGRLMWRKSYTLHDTPAPWFCIQGDGMYACLFKTIYKFDKTNGNEIWKVDLKERVARGTFLVGTEKGILLNTVYDRLHLLDMTNGKILWNVKLSQYEPTDPENCAMPSGTPAIMNGKIYIVARGSVDKSEPKVVKCIDLETGKTVWEVAIPGTSVKDHSDVSQTTSCAPGVVYTLTEDQTALNTKIRAFDPDSGLLLWQDTISGQTNPSEMAIVSGFMVIGMEAQNDHGKPYYYYRVYTNLGVKPPKLDVSEEQIKLGYVNEKKFIKQIVNVRNSGSGEITGVVVNTSKWFTVTPTQFSGNDVELSILVDTSKLTAGIYKDNFTIKTNGGTKNVEVLMSYGGTQIVKTSTLIEKIVCKDIPDWNKRIALKGFQHGGVAVTQPWIVVTPSYFEDTDPSVLVLLNPSMINEKNLNGKVVISTNTDKIELELTIVSKPGINIIMTVNSKNAVVNGKPIVIDPPPQIINGKTVVPLRFIGDAFSVKTEYDAKTKTIIITSDVGKKIVLTIGSNKAEIEGHEVTISPAPLIIKGKTMVPLRLIADAFEAEVKYEALSKRITIIRPSCP